MVTRIPISLHIFSNSISAIVNAVAAVGAVAVRVGQNLRLWPRSLQRLHLYRTGFACFDNDAIADMAVSCCELL